jgi:NitT/TauT family transport system ATP-binding protein
MALALDTTNAKIVVAGVSRDFSGRRSVVHALDDVDLVVEDGQFVCLVGPSGCGKSTLLRMMAGLLRPSRGYVEVRPRDAARPPTAMVFQDYGIYPWKTVLANVRFGLVAGNVKKAEANERAHHWLRKLGLEEFADAYPSELSGGMRQRVSIARALAVEPEVLLMDEPFAALDAQLRTILQEELLTLWQEDRRTVVFITHSLEEAILLGDRVVVMSSRPGRIVGDYQVPFARPRDMSIRSTGEFGEVQEKIWAQLRDEVDRSLAR